MESLTTPTADQLIDASGESLAILERVLAGVKECQADRDWVRLRLLLLEAVQVPVMTEEMLVLLEEVVEDDMELLALLWRRGALLGHGDHALKLGIWHDVREHKAQAVGWLETARDLGNEDAAEELAELAGSGDVPRASGDGRCIGCRRPTGLPVALRYCDDCLITTAIWRPDVWAVTRAAQHIGLKQNVDIVVAEDGWELGEAGRRVIRTGTYYGVRRFVDGAWETTDAPAPAELTLDAHHIIVASARLEPEHATRVLWHELAHARSLEQAPLTWSTAYAAEEARIAVKYRTSDATAAQRHQLNTYEIEAVALEHEADGFEPLTLANRRASLPHSPQHQEIAQVVQGRIVPGPYAQQLRERRVQRRREAALRKQGALREPDPRTIRRDDAPRTQAAGASAPIRTTTAVPGVPWEGWLGSIIAFAVIYALLTVFCLKLGATGGATAVTDTLAAGVVLGAAYHMRVDWLGTLLLAALAAIPWFIATAVVNAALFAPYAPY